MYTETLAARLKFFFYQYNSLHLAINSQLRVIICYIDALHIFCTGTLNNITLGKEK